MNRVEMWILGVLALGAAPLWGQNVQRVVRIIAGEEEPPPAATPPAEHRLPAATESRRPVLYLRDGSRVAGTPRIEFLEVATRYGKLRIPRAELIRIRFALRLPSELEQRIGELIRQLGDEDFDRRETAYEELKKVGAVAIPFLKEAESSPNEEIKSRAKLLIEELRASAEKSGGREPAPKRAEGKDDEILTTRMAIRGRVLLDKFEVDTRYGMLTIWVRDLDAISFRAAQPEETKLTVRPSHQVPASWLDTEVNVEKGQILRIEASGVMSVSNYGVSCGPEGTRQWSGNSYGNFPMLSLVGKIGKKGKPFLIGRQYKAKAPKGGTLYIGIVPFSFYPQGTQGAYQVRVRVEGSP